MSKNAEQHILVGINHGWSTLPNKVDRDLDLFFITLQNQIFKLYVLDGLQSHITKTNQLVVSLEICSLICELLKQLSYDIFSYEVAFESNQHKLTKSSKIRHISNHPCSGRDRVNGTVKKITVPFSLTFLYSLLVLKSPADQLTSASKSM
jgi:hypothetical protein